MVHYKMKCTASVCTVSISMVDNVFDVVLDMARCLEYSLEKYTWHILTCSC
jgi:hypothetical protein